MASESTEAIINRVLFCILYLHFIANGYFKFAVCDFVLVNRIIALFAPKSTHFSYFSSTAIELQQIELIKVKKTVSRHFPKIRKKRGRFYK